MNFFIKKLYSKIGLDRAEPDPIGLNIRGPIPVRAENWRAGPGRPMPTPVFNLFVGGTASKSGFKASDSYFWNQLVELDKMYFTQFFRKIL